MERHQSSSSDESLSRVLIHSADQTSEHTLPLSITPSSSTSSVIKTTRRTIQTQTIKEVQRSLPSKPIPSFAETQLLSVYYPSENPKTSSTNDKCIFVEQQDRQPIRYRSAYDPSLMQTLPPLSTQGSTIIVKGNNENKPGYNQYVKIHSGNQHPTTNFDDQSDGLIEQTKYSYEEYILNQNRTTSSSSSSSSVTTVIAQNEELDSDQTSHLTFDDLNTQSSTNSTLTNQRISSWPPVPDEALLSDNEEQKRPSRVQFAEQLYHVIPISTSNSLTEEPTSPPPIIPRKTLHDTDTRQPINQSKWIKTHMDNSDVQTNATSNRVDTLRSLFEQQQTIHSSVNNQNQRIEPEEKPSKHGVEIRFRVNDPNTSNIYHAEPAKVLQQPETTSITITKEQPPFKLEQIEQITGRTIKDFNEIGHYLSDGCTWQWNEKFWLSLTTSQRDQLKNLEQRILSRENSFDQSLSSNETKRFKSTTSITGAGAWQHNNKPQTSTSARTKYTEINTIDKNQTSVSVFSTTPSSNIIRNNSQESLNSSINPNKRTDSQLTIIESGYNSADDQQKFRPNSKPIIEESSSEDLLSYEQFIIEYLSQYSKHIRSNNGTLTLLIDEQQIPMTNVFLPTSNENLIFDKNIYRDAINQNLLPFETELNQLVIFISNEAIIIPSDRWIIYRKKYQNAQWIEKLKKINRNIPSQLIPITEQWLSDHAIVELDTQQINIDGLMIPLIGRLGLHLFDSYKIRQLQTTYWNDILKYLIHIGYLSYDINKKFIYISNIELDCQRLLKSPTIDENHIQYLKQWLEQLNEQRLITITDDNNIIIYPNNSERQIFIKHEHIDEYMETNTDVINMNDIAHVLLQYNYVQYSSGQLKYRNQIIELDTNEFLWLQSIIRSIRIIEHTEQTEIELFDGQNKQILQIPYEHMPPTKNTRIIAEYLFKNGNIRFDADNEQYAYRYIAPVEKSQSVQRSSQHKLLASHIRHIHIDKIKREIQIEFSHDPDEFLQLPLNWYEDISKHNFDHSYIIDMLFTNDGIIDEDNFIFNNNIYSLKFSSKQKQDLINYYVDFVNNQDGIKFDHKTNLLLLENPSDGSELYLTNEHTDFIRKNQYRRRDMKYLLNKYSYLKQDEFNNYLLYYNNQCIQIPTPDDQTEFHQRFHKTIDYMYNQNLIISNQQLNILQIHFTNQLLTIPFNEIQLTTTNLPLNTTEISQWLIKNSTQIIPLVDGHIQLTYKNQIYILPLIDQDLKLLFPSNKSQRLIQKSSSSTTLDIEQPTEENNYTIDPLLILANYIYRAATIYQDNYGRLVIKLYKDEIVIPYIQAVNSIQAINTSPNRTGTIIARLIYNIGKVQSNQYGGIIITIGNKSIELTKQILDQTSENFTTMVRSKSSSSIDSIDNSIKKSSSVLLKPRLLIMHGDEINRTTRYYIQYTYENDRKSSSVMMLPSRYPIQPTQPQLITPEHYRDKSLRDASVYVYNSNEKEIFYENLAQYLSTNQNDLSSQIVRRMLKFSTRDEYYNYLINYMSTSNAQELVEESEELLHEVSSQFSNIRIGTPDRELNESSSAFYNVKNGTMIKESNRYEAEEQHYNYSSKTIERTSSSSSRSPQTVNSQSLTTPDKNITLPRSTTLSGQSNDGESESRATVSRSASAAAKVPTSKSDTMKSTTSSSAASSREYPVISSSSTVVRTQSLVSPNRTSGSKGTGDETTKKEKKSKFRTPSFLRKRKEKKEAANKEKAEK